MRQVTVCEPCLRGEHDQCWKKGRQKGWICECEAVYRHDLSRALPRGDKDGA